jgi:hypothetical protein
MKPGPIAGFSGRGAESFEPVQDQVEPELEFGLVVAPAEHRAAA